MHGFSHEDLTLTKHACTWWYKPLVSALPSLSAYDMNHSLCLDAVPSLPAVSFLPWTTADT